MCAAEQGRRRLWRCTPRLSTDPRASSRSRVENYKLRANMHSTIKPVLAALGAALILMAFVGSTSANRLSVNEQFWREVYTPFTATASDGAVVRCNLTYEGSFHGRVISKVRGSLIGFTTSATVGSCSPPSALIIGPLPAHQAYEEFGGTLPSPNDYEGVITRFSFEVQGEIFGIRVRCRYTPARVRRINNRETRGAIVSQRLEEGSIASETFGCPETRLSGTGSVRTPGGGAITIFLS